MRAEVLKSLLLALDECPADADGKAEFRRLIYAVGDRNGAGGIE